MNTTEAFAEGAKIGHAEGQGRAGQYIIAEEYSLSWDAVDRHAPIPSDNSEGYGRCLFAWIKGYQAGYKLAAEGSPLTLEDRT